MPYLLLQGFSDFLMLQFCKVFYTAVFSQYLNVHILILCISFRAYSAAAPLALVDGSSGLVVAGGYSGTQFLDSIEVFSEDGWLDIMFSLPVTVYQHCLVAIDDNTIILIGGIQAIHFLRMLI